MASTTNLFDHSPDALVPQSSIKEASASEPPASGSKLEAQLGVDYRPSDYSVLCSRGKDIVNHVGNRRFRVISSTYVEKYARAESKAAKSFIVSEIITEIRQAGGNFCRQKRGRWFEVGDTDAREKVSALMRDLLHTQYRSSNKSKVATRRARKESQNQQSGQEPLDDAGDSEDDSSLSSSCWGSSKDVLEYSRDYEFFDMDVFG
jgi:hypothetical protein